MTTTMCEAGSEEGLRQSLRDIPLEVLFGLRFGESGAQEEVYRQCVRPVTLAIQRAFGGKTRLDLDAVVASAFRTYFRYPVVSRKEPGELHGEWGGLVGHIIRTAHNKALRDLRALGRETPLSAVAGDERVGAPEVLDPSAPGLSPLDTLIDREEREEAEGAVRLIANIKGAIRSALRRAVEPELAGLRTPEDKAQFHRQYGAALGLTTGVATDGPVPATTKEALKKRGQRRAQKVKARLLRLLGRPEPAPVVVAAEPVDDLAFRNALGDRIAEIVGAIVQGLAPHDLLIYCGALDRAPAGQIAASLPAGHALSPDLIRNRETTRVLNEVDAILKSFATREIDPEEADHDRSGL
jgi:hypothetical protein